MISRVLPIGCVMLLAGCGGAANGDALAMPSSPTNVVKASATVDKAFDPLLTDVEGHTHQPFASAETKALVLVFVLPDCPIANSVMPELNRLQAEYASRGVAVLLVHVDSEVTADQARQHAREYEVLAPVVLDPQHAWVKRADATTTPEAAVFTRSGELVYRSRINDLYAGLGKRRQQATSHDLRDAIEAVLVGRPVSQPRTEAVGCPIPELDNGD